VVEKILIIELKSVEQLAPVHYKQLLTYLRLMHLPVGLLLNFGAATFREGIKRVVNEHHDLSGSRLRVNQKPGSSPIQSNAQFMLRSASKTSDRAR
jgi:iron complex transport system substrate-binding protein